MKLVSKDGNKAAGYRDAVYASNGSAYLNPNIYLTFATKGLDKPNAVYTSYPQLFRLRALFKEVAELLQDDKGFVKTQDGTLVVRPEYSNAFVYSNIGKGNNWIALKLCCCESGENGVTHVEPAVSLELSTSNGYNSVLTIDEFLTVYTIIMDLDLASIQCMTSLAFLDCDRTQVQQGYGQSMPQQGYGMGYTPQPMQQPVYNNNPYMQYPQQPQQGGYQQKPSYQRKPYQGQTRQATPYQQAMSTQLASQQPVESTPYISAKPAPTAAPFQNEMPARDERKLSFASVESTEVSDYTIDDDDLIGSIFSNGNDE